LLCGNCELEAELKPRFLKAQCTEDPRCEVLLTQTVTDLSLTAEEETRIEATMSRLFAIMTSIKFKRVPPLAA